MAYPYVSLKATHPWSLKRGLFRGFSCQFEKSLAEKGVGVEGKIKVSFHMHPKKGLKAGHTGTLLNLTVRSLTPALPGCSRLWRLKSIRGLTPETKKPMLAPEYKYTPRKRLGPWKDH